MPFSSRNKKRLRPLAPAPLRSLKRARQVTTSFHRLSRQLTAAQAQGDAQEIARITKQIEEAGGRDAYQQASQVSTAVHSTSKWVIAHLVGNGWIRGVPLPTEHANNKPDQRPTRLLEVGAINTQLLDAARRSNGKLSVRAIDLQSTHAEIEEADFLQLPLESNAPFDVIVCSMVLNCVNTPEERGEMICRLYHFCLPGGLVFVTIPRTCLELSPYIDGPAFADMLNTVGFEVVEQKTSPKLSFFILRRSTGDTSNSPQRSLSRWVQVKTVRRGKKFRNDFAVTFAEDSLRGLTLASETSRDANS